ncbi:MAG TPA: alpha/beta hydrolase [Microscillaceae bacterium]|nr:alpha/beta hydrolase [Microscillaceae bacterium]
MKRIVLISCLWLILFSDTFAQKLYLKTFGQATQPAMIYLHGGPGYNSASFEFTTAQKLANAGFFVIVYDRRGEGRSTDAKAKFSFEETFADLHQIYAQYKLKKATLLGHSFGGVVATLFAEKHPKKIQAVVLVGAPVALQETFETIIGRVKKIYQDKNDEANLQYVSRLENMDKKSIQYSSYCFMHAMQNGFYTPKKTTQEAKTIYAQFGTNALLKKYARQMSYAAPQGFWKNEQYTTIDLTKVLMKLKAQKLPLYGLYGQDDGLYSKHQVESLATLIGKENLKYYEQCSHSVFIDQQTKFINALKTWVKN